jgi:Concanavalin A-like lectin/glucanases superfamily
MDDGSGSTAADSSGNGDTGSFAGGTNPTWTGGELKSALNFTGGATTNYVSVPNASNLSGMSTLTVSFWAYVDGATANGYGPISKRQSTCSPGCASYGVEIDTTNHRWDPFVSNTTGAVNAFTASANGSLVFNTWQFVTMTYDGSNVQMYINGVASGGTGALTGSVMTSNDVLQIGNSPTNLGVAAKIDDVRIYNRALSATEIANLYSASYAGDIIYNSAYGVEQYCNGGNWVSTGPVGNTATGLVGWWKLDETSGSSAADSSGNGNDGGLDGGPIPTWTTGIIGGALLFSPNSDLHVTDVASLDLAGSWTTSAWVKLTSTPGSGSYMGFIARDDVTGYSNYFLMIDNGALSSGLGWAINFNTSTGAGGNLFAKYAASISTSAWYFVAGVYNSSAQTLTLYLNGTAVATQSVAGYMPASGGGSQFNLGSESGGGGFLNGAIDDARVYNRALSANDIMALYTSTGGGSGDISSNLVGYWKLDETSGTSANDSSGSGNTGTVTPNATGVWVAGKVNNGAKLNGTTQYVNVPDAASLRFSGSWSVSGWVKLSALSGASSVANIFAKQTSASGTVNYTLSVDNNGNCAADPTFGVAFTNTSGTVAAACYNVVVTTGTWYYVTGVWNSSATALSLYVNGISVGSTTTALVPDNRSGYPLTIGDVFGAYFLKGTLDDMRIYSRALSAADVLTLYNSSKSACASPAGYAGDTMYNSTSHVPAFCDGAKWQPMGPVPGAGGGGCSSPTGTEGDFVFNSTAHALEYCDGAKWVAAGGTPVAPSNGLVGWWKLDDGSSGSTPTTAADSSGNGATGTLNNSPTWTTGEIGNALTFNGTSQSVSVPDSSQFHLSGDWSASVWFKLNSLPTTGNYYEIFARDGASNYETFAFFIADNYCGASGGYADFNINYRDSTGTLGTTACNPNNVTTGVWYNGAVVWNSTAKTLTYYLNGVLQKSVSETNTPTSASGGGVYLGYDPYYGTHAPVVLDDVRIYNRALSAEEVWTLYLATGGT